MKKLNTLCIIIGIISFVVAGYILTEKILAKEVKVEINEEKELKEVNNYLAKVGSPLGWLIIKKGIDTQDENGKYEEMTGKRCIRIVFKSNSSFEPVIANMVLACKAPVNILLADTKDIGGVAHGQMILQLPDEAVAAEKMIQYLRDRNLEVEELKNYVG